MVDIKTTKNTKSPTNGLRTIFDAMFEATGGELMLSKRALYIACNEYIDPEKSYLPGKPALIWRREAKSRRRVAEGFFYCFARHLA